MRPLRCCQGVLFLSSLVFTFGQVLVPTTLSRCPKDSTTPEKVHIAYVQAIPPNGGAVPFLPHVNLVPDVAVRYYNNIGYGDIALTSSVHDFNFSNATALVQNILVEHADDNVVAFLGTGIHNHNVKLQAEMRRRKKYLYMDYIQAPRKTEDLFSNTAYYDYITAAVFVRQLIKMGIRRVGLIRDNLVDPWLQEFEAFSLQHGLVIEVVSVVPHANAHSPEFEDGIHIRNAVQAIKDHDVRYVIALAPIRELTMVLAHAFDEGLDDHDRPITWIGNERMMYIINEYTTVKRLWGIRHQANSPFGVFQSRFPMSASFENITHMLDGSLISMHYTQLSAMGENFLTDVLAASGSDRVGNDFDHLFDTQFVLYGDLYLTLGYAVNAMSNAGYGCHLHASNFTSEVSHTLYEFQKRVFAESFTELLQFNLDGDRVLSNLTTFGCSSLHQTHAFADDANWDPAEDQEGKLRCVPHHLYDASTGELIWESLDPPVFWHDGTSTPPGPAPSDGTVLEEPDYPISPGSHEDPWLLTTVLPAVCSTIVLIFAAVVYKLWRQNRVMKALLMENIQSETKKLNLESPLMRTIKLLQSIHSGKRVDPEVALTLSLELLTSKDVMRPNLREQLTTGKSPYNPNVSMFLMQTTQDSLNTDRGGKAIRPSLESNEGGDDSKRQTRPSLLSNCSSGSYTGLTIDSEIAVEYRLQNPTSPRPCDPEVEDYLRRNRLGEDLHFNILGVGNPSEQRPLTECTMFLVKKLGLIEKLSLLENNLKTFLLEVESGYDSKNPYHNNAHAADVTQRLVTVLCVSGAYPSQLSDLEMFSAIIAAVIHDYAHPGRNNQFMVNTQHKIAQQHNDQHVLENHSLWVCLSLLGSCNVLRNVPKKAQKELRRLVISMVLATDMAEHFRVVGQFSQKVSRGDVESGSKALRPDQRAALLEVALKVADIGHVTLFQAEHLHWVKGLQEEFFSQGDEERKHNLTISPLCNRKKRRNGPASGENQIGFFDVICDPLFSAFVDVYPSCGTLKTQLAQNYKFWKEEMQNKDKEIDDWVLNIPRNNATTI